jgi:putative hydrolase of the HAD superfamily
LPFIVKTRDKKTTLAASAAEAILYNLRMKSLLFDFGGTLDADGTTWLDRFHPLYKEEGLDIPAEKLARAFYDSDDNLHLRHQLKGLDLAETVRLQVADVIKAAAPDRQELIDRVAGRFTADCRESFARLKPSLERLAKKYRLGIVSNFYGNLDGILQAEGLRPLFSVVADSGVLGVGKPDAAIFLHAAKGVGAAPADCVMVGDSIKRDIAGAAGVGMKKALVSAAAEKPEAGQDWTIRSVLELEALL